MALGSPLTVLHLLAPAPAGGLERVVQGLARGQAEVGHRVIVGAVAAREGEAHGFLAPLRGSAVDARFLEIPNRAYLLERRTVRGLCQELHPDVVHTHGYRPDVVDAGVARREGVPTVTTVHGFIGGTVRGRIYERLQRRAFRRFGAVVAVAGAQVDILRASGLPADRIRVVPNALDPIPLLSREDARAGWGVLGGEFHVGWVGRLSREKGPDVLLEALALLDHPDLRASFVGDGPLEEALRARAQQAGMGERVRLAGRVPDVAARFKGFDVLVMSSRTEGAPMVLLEAMAAGVPVVATRVGGIPDMVGSGEATLVASEDPAALARAIGDVRRDPVAAAERAAAARRRFEDAFGFDAWVRTYDDIYHGVIAAGRLR